MANANIHTVPRGGQWANVAEGRDDAISTHATKEEAVDAGRQRARQDQVEHLIHNEDGTIGERNSYGPDPHPPTG